MAQVIKPAIIDMICVKSIILLLGTALIILGYYLLAVPPSAEYAEMFARARYGTVSVVCGSTCIMLWLAKR